MYRLLSLLVFLQIAQKLNICEEVQQDKDEYQELRSIVLVSATPLRSPVCAYSMDWPFELQLDLPLEHFVEPERLWEGIQVLL